MGWLAMVASGGTSDEQGRGGPQTRLQTARCQDPVPGDRPYGANGKEPAIRNSRSLAPWIHPGRKGRVVSAEDDVGSDCRTPVESIGPVSAPR